MAGIYIHIPFCKQRCHYCDFHKSTSLEKTGEFIDALSKEIELRRNYIGDEPVESIYIGGGTPSVLSVQTYVRLLDTLNKLFNIQTKAEITFEANPDDLTEKYVHHLANSPVNRLSIGIQSWCRKELELLNRRHDEEQGRKAVRNAQKAGFKNLSLDLIYGIPGSGPEKWRDHLRQTFALDIQHLSAYHLTIEPGTVFGKRLKAGKFMPVEEEESLRQMDILSEEALKAGFQQYEISNFCREGFMAVHNVNYWKQKKYIGFGPSAHSFNGYSREWNEANNRIYILSLKKEVVPSQKELLSYKDKYNEYILTSLRTQWGIDLDELELQFQKEGKDYCFNLAGRFIQYGMLKHTEENHLVLTQQGRHVADNLISELMMT